MCSSPCNGLPSYSEFKRQFIFNNPALLNTHLLKGKDVLVEVKLNLFVGDVDAQLLKRVLLEVLKSKDVQDSHIHSTFRGTSKEEKGDIHTYFSA